MSTNEELIRNAKRHPENLRIAGFTSSARMIEALVYALEAVESPTTVEWGVQVQVFPDGSFQCLPAVSEQEARALLSRRAVKRNVGPWEVAK